MLFIVGTVRVPDTREYQVSAIAGCWLVRNFGSRILQIGLYLHTTVHTAVSSSRQRDKEDFSKRFGADRGCAEIVRIETQ